ncbi:MAG: hypothetical protein PSX80_13120 [bacterium]|nr:hypothetical protein [bacterium]
MTRYPRTFSDGVFLGSHPNNHKHLNSEDLPNYRAALNIPDIHTMYELGENVAG